MISELLLWVLEHQLKCNWPHFTTASEIARDHMHGTFDWASVFNRIEVGPGLIHVERTIWL